jgi:hypothetical protein
MSNDDFSAPRIIPKSSGVAVRSGDEKPRAYCMVPNCMRYVGFNAELGIGIYARSFADVCFTNSREERIELCGFHYLEGMDKVGKSGRALLRADPESIVSQVEAQLKRNREV